MITPNQARHSLLATLKPTPAEPVALHDALGLVLAEDVTAPGMLPAFDHAAMDGFAIVADDTELPPVRLQVAGLLPAGVGATEAGRPGQAIRIMTGAMVPAGMDAVIPFEQVDEEDGWITVHRRVAAGADIRRAGEDVRQGRLVLRAGEELTSAKLTLLAALGIGTVRVHRRPRVAILVTGDELVAPGLPLGPGQIHDCNTTALVTLVREAGGVPVIIGRATDDRQETLRLLERACEADLVLTTGGVSKGDYDFVADVAGDLGSIVFAGVAQQPGKPLTVARIGDTTVVALPGTPVATLVTGEYYVRPAIRRLLGHGSLHRPLLSVILSEGIRLHPARQQFLRAVVHHGRQGHVAQLVEGPGQKFLSAYAAANALLSIPPGQGRLEPGDHAVAIVLQAEELLPRAAMRPLDNEPDPAPAGLR